MFRTRQKFLAILISCLYATSGYSTDLPEMPFSMIGKLTSPLAKIQFKDINFKPGSALLSKADQKRIENLAKQLESMDVYVIIEAYSDADGEEEANLLLSEKRARSARKAFLNPTFCLQIR